MDDKDAGAIVDALAPACAAFVCTEIPEQAIEGSGRPGGGSHSAAELAAALPRRGGRGRGGLGSARSPGSGPRGLPRERGAVALATGSHYLLGCLWTERHEASS